MGYELKLWLLVFVLLLASNLLSGEPQVPCFFIFGDSLTDNGNNRNLSTIVKANYLPNGIDFPHGPTGRFCNGRTTADVIAELLGFDDYIPCHATTRGPEKLQGLNYASAAAGIRDETGMTYGERLAFNKQLKNHQNTVSQVVKILGNEKLAAKYLSKCLYLVEMGSNDYINNYFVPRYYSTSRQYTPEQYADVLIKQYSQQLRTLYNHGARKVILAGVGPGGCIPSVLASHSPDGSSCVDNINSAIRIFNSKLKSLVDYLNNNLTNAKFIYVDFYGFFQDILISPSFYGFKVTNAACCGFGKNNGKFPCTPLQIPCWNRSEYIFWDTFHTSDAANAIMGRRAYSAESSSDAYPIDIRHLALL